MKRPIDRRTPGSPGHPLVVAGAAAAALLFCGLGAWALLAPGGFYDTIAIYPPYSRHLIHDLGAFQIGIGACLWFAIFVRDSLLAALAGGTAGAIAHLVSHVVDRSLGGHSIDLPGVGLIALVLAVLTVAQWRRTARVRSGSWQAA
jgi:hypothetical protein